MKIEKVIVGCPVEYFKTNLVPVYESIIARKLRNGKKVCFIFPCLHEDGKSYTGSIFPMDDGSIVFDLDSNN